MGCFDMFAEQGKPDHNAHQGVKSAMLHPRSATNWRKPAPLRMTMEPSATSWSVWAAKFALLIRAWNRRRIFQLLFVLTFVAAGCGRTLTADVYETQAVRNASDAEIAIVEGKTARMLKIDGKELEHPNPDMYYASARLRPGLHAVTLNRWFVVSVLLVSRGYVDAVKTYSVNLQAGHVYELHADRTTGPGFRIAMWIKDATTGEIVAGQELN